MLSIRQLLRGWRPWRPGHGSSERGRPVTLPWRSGPARHDLTTAGVGWSQRLTPPSRASPGTLPFFAGIEGLTTKPECGLCSPHPVYISYTLSTPGGIGSSGVDAAVGGTDTVRTGRKFANGAAAYSFEVTTGNINTISPADREVRFETVTREDWEPYFENGRQVIQSRTRGPRE